LLDTLITPLIFWRVGERSLQRLLADSGQDSY
jgi:hypothetical protein